MTEVEVFAYNRSINGAISANERDLDETKRSEECYETYCRGFGSDIGLVRLLYLG